MVPKLVVDDIPLLHSLLHSLNWRVAYPRAFCTRTQHRANLVASQRRLAVSLNPCFTGWLVQP
jgi:hypothetical protein